MMVKQVSPWDGISISGDPQLILGRKRGSKEIETCIVPIGSQIFGSLRELAQKSLDALEESTPREYHPNASLEEGNEYFKIPISDIPKRELVKPQEKAERKEVAGGSGNGELDADNAISEGFAIAVINEDYVAKERTNPDRTAALVRSLSGVESLHQIEVGEIKNFKAIFYSVAFQQEDNSWVHFIKKNSPTSIFKPGRVWAKFNGDLETIATPDLLLYEDFDIVLGRENIAGFKAFPLQVLFTDVGLMMQSIPSYVSEMAELLGEEFPLSEGARSALMRQGKRTVPTASRIYRLVDRIKELNLDSDRLSSILERHKVDPSSIMSSDGNFDFDEKGVSTFLDVVEGRYFEDDWTGELRRADKFSRRG